MNFISMPKNKTPVERLSNPRVHKDPPNVLLSTPPNARPDPCGAENDVEGHPGTASSRHATLHDMQVEHTLNKTKKKKENEFKTKLPITVPLEKEDNR